MPIFFVILQNMQNMKTSVILRFAIIGLLWAAICGMLLVRAPRITLYTLFVVVASGIIVFVPMYKKYVKNDKH